MTADPRWSAETENGLTQMLAEEFVVSTTGSRDPNRLATRAVLDWMAHRGLLVEAGGSTQRREEYAHEHVLADGPGPCVPLHNHQCPDSRYVRSVAVHRGPWRRVDGSQP